MATYTLREKLQTTRHADLFRAVRTEDRRPVVLKILAGSSDPQEPGRLRHELALGTECPLQSLLQPLALDSYDGRPALVMEDFAGSSLDQLDPGRPMELDRFLPLARRIANAVAALHACGVVHRDLQPQNILLSASGEVRIAGLGIATRAADEATSTDSPPGIEGSLPYVSPEQTGRTNRPIDARSDLYTLGVTFFQLLTGRLPFDAEDAVGWVHCHVARRPPAPVDRVRGLPRVVSDLVLRLLAKLPEERYQSAVGLEHDLARCEEAWTTDREIPPFRLGEHDFSGSLRFTRKLVGREAERSELVAAVERVATGSGPELVLVSGEPGVGKSTLVENIRAPVGVHGGAFVAAKFEQYKQEIPLYAVADACRILLLEILAQSEAGLATWRRRIDDALGSNAQLLGRVIPQLAMILGPGPPPDELTLAETEHRLSVAFARLLAVLARPDRPVAIFLDDLQWADPASLHLVAHVLAEGHSKHLLVIGAYRPGDVGPAHPLRRMLSRVREAGASVRELTLSNMTVSRIGDLVADALQMTREQVASLAVLVHRKTGGNPFFAVHFLRTLEQRGLLGFVARTGSWQWDADRIETEDFTDNVVDLLVARVRRLPPDTQTVLQICACLGSAFDLGILSLAFARDPACLDASLRPALEGELLLRTGSRLRFAHDRVQEAAYSLIPEEERPALHLRMGRLLAEQVDHTEIAIFEIVGHLNRGAALLETEEERIRVAHLDLAAARRAKKSAAFDAGLEYADRGMALLPADAWDTHSDLCSGLHFAAARCALATGQAGRAEPLVDALRGRARTFREDVDITRLGIELHTLRGDHAGGAAVGLDCLRRLGTDWPPHPSLHAVVRAYDELQRILGDRSIEDLADLPRMQHPRALAVLDLLNAVHDPAMFTDANLIALLGCEQARLSILHGNAPGSAPGYATLALVVGPMFGRYADAPRWGRLGAALVESGGIGGIGAMALLDCSLSLQWAAHLRETLELQLRAHEAAAASGNYRFACYALNNSITARLVLGDRLSDVERAADDALRFVRRAGFPLVETIIVTQRRLIRHLRGREEGSSVDEAGFEAALEAGLPDTAIATCWYFVWKLEARWLAGDFEAAVSAARRAEDLSWASPTFVEMSELHYFHGLALSARWDAADVATREADRCKLRELVARFHEWASLCPANFAHRHALLAGELARIESRRLDAEESYEHAIRCARQHGFVSHAAVSLEVASRAFSARGLRIAADAYLREARACYATWGADAQVERIDRRLAERGSRTAGDSSGPARAVTPRELDLVSVVKASQTISSVIDREHLVRTLLEVVLERGGARVARIVLTDGDRPTLMAEASVGEKDVHTVMLHTEDPRGLPRVPETIFQYVRRTRERVVLDDATRDPGAFGGDRYLASARPRSLACLPVIREGAVIALLDLENDLVPGVFTADRLTTLELLASQAAISLENARLVRMSEAALRDAEAARVRAEESFEERRRVAADSRFLADASEALAGSLDYESTLSRVAHLAVPFLADWCIVDIREDGAWRRVARAHVDPAQEQLLARLEGFPVDVGANQPAALAIAEGRTLILADLSDDELRGRARSEEHAAVLRALRPRRVVVVPLWAHGQVLGAMSFVASRAELRYDTETVAVAEELGRRAAVALDNARLYREAQASILARDEFLSTASHELRSPVNALLLAAQGLGRGTIQPTPRHLHVVAGLVERQAFRLARLIDEMLLVGRLHLGRLELDVTEVDLASVVHRVMDELASAITESGCAIALQSTTPVVGHWDRGKIAAIVTNLLDNALKFGRGRPVEIVVEEAGDDARLSVTDHGIGIAPEALPHVFDKFTRAVSTRSYGGLGLGLHVVRGLALAHGGSVAVTSEPGVSTTFTVVLPRRRDE